MAIAIVEVLSVPVVLFADLPLKATLTLRLASGATLRATTSRDVAARALAATPPEPILTPAEYEALAAALEDGRLSRAEAAAELAEKLELAHPEHRLTRARLLGPVRSPERRSRHGWTWGELAAAVGAEVVGVEVEENAPSAAASNATGEAA